MLTLSTQALYYCISIGIIIAFLAHARVWPCEPAKVPPFIQSNIMLYPVLRMMAWGSLQGTNVHLLLAWDASEDPKAKAVSAEVQK